MVLNTEVMANLPAGSIVRFNVEQNCYRKAGSGKWQYGEPGDNNHDDPEDWNNWTKNYLLVGTIPSPPEQHWLNSGQYELHVIYVPYTEVGRTRNQERAIIDNIESLLSDVTNRVKNGEKVNATDYLWMHSLLKAFELGQQGKGWNDEL